MISKIDIYRSANVLVKRYGEDAALKAAQRAYVMLERGDMDGRSSQLLMEPCELLLHRLLAAVLPDGTGGNDVEAAGAEIPVDGLDPVLKLLGELLALPRRDTRIADGREDRLTDIVRRVQRATMLRHDRPLSEVLHRLQGLAHAERRGRRGSR